LGIGAKLHHGQQKAHHAIPYIKGAEGAKSEGREGEQQADLSGPREVEQDHRAIARLQSRRPRLRHQGGLRER